MAKAIKNALTAAFVVFLAATGTIHFFGAAALGGATALGMAALTFGMTLVSSVIGGMTSKGINASQQNFGTKFAARGATVPRQLIYGKCRVGGTIVHLETTGTDNYLLHMVVVLAGHEIESLESVRLNDITLTTSSSTINSTTVFTVTNSEFSNTDNDNKLDSNGRLVRFCFEDGSQTAANAYAVAQSSLISTDKFLDCAYVYMQMVFDRDKFGGGMPNISFVVKGKKVYDPRSGETAWTDSGGKPIGTNPALCIRDYLTNTTYGLKALSSEINDTTNLGGVAAAANACEVDVTLADGSTTEDKYTTNGFTNFSASGTGVIEGLLSSMAGKLSYTNGQFNIFAGTTQTPSLTITDDNLLSPVQITTNANTGELYNTVKPIYVDSTNNFIAADAPIYQDSTFLTQDTPNGVANDKPNYVKQMEKQLPFTVTHTMAQRIGRLALNNQRFNTTISCLVDMSFMKLQPADWVYVTNERLSFSQKVFEVLSVNMEVMQSDETPMLGVRLNLKEADNSIFSFATSDYQTPIVAGSDLPTGAFTLSPPTNLTIVTDSTTVDVLTTTSVTASWTNAASPFIIGTEVQYKKASASNYATTFAGQGETKQQITGLEVGVAYNFRVAHLSMTGRSAYDTENHTVSGTALAANSLKNDQITVNTTSGILENIGTSNVVVNNTKVDYSSDGVNTLPANRGGTGITNFANSTHLNSNTTKSDVGLGNVDNESSATIRGQTTSGNHTGTVGGVANSTITTGSSRANSNIDGNGRFTGDLTGNIRSNGTTKTPAELIDAHTRATTGLNASGVVQVAVPSAQISGALTTVLTASPSNSAQWTTNDGAIYSPTGQTQDITVTADNGINSETCVIRWRYVNTSNSNADYIDLCQELTDSSNAFTLGSITDLSGNNVKYATCVVTHTASSTTITLQALLSQLHVSGGGK